MWRRGDLEWKLWPQQVPIYQGIRSLASGIETVVILCARQFGKSHLGVILAIEDCLRFPNRCILVMGPTAKQTTEIVAPRIRDIMLDAPEGLIRRSKSEGKWYIGESELVIGGFDQNSGSQRGKTVQTIYIEEVVDSNPDDYTESMRSDLGPALTHSKGGKMIFLTTLPKIPSHPFILDTLPEARLAGSFYSYTIDDNQALSEEQYNACVRRTGGRDSPQFRREYLNEIIRDESTSIVPHFDVNRHVKDIGLPAGGHYATVIDFGGVRDKTVALITVYDFLRNKLLVLAERVFESNTPTNSIVESIRIAEAQYGVGRRFADAPGQLIVDLNNLKDAQGRQLFAVQLPHKDDWLAAVNAMQVMFSLNQVEIDRSCPFLIETLISGQFDKKKTDFGRTKAFGHCDAAAALMYAVRMSPRGNPYEEMFQAPQNHFVVRQPETPEMQLAELLQPKPFANSFNGLVAKKFGKFK
jgi:hypothetical protein